MKYWVNVNLLKRKAVIHRYYCQRVNSRPKDPALDNEWWETETRQEARQLAKLVDKNSAETCQQCIGSGFSQGKRC